MTGLLLIPQGIGGGLGMFLSGRLTERFGAGRTSFFGAMILAVATIPFVLVTATTPYATIGTAMIFRGIGIGLSIMPAMTAAFSVLPREKVNDASPQLTVLQRVGGSLGTAIFAVVLEGQTSSAHTAAAAAAGVRAHLLVGHGRDAAGADPDANVGADRAAGQGQCHRDAPSRFAVDEPLLEAA